MRTTSAIVLAILVTTSALAAGVGVGASSSSIASSTDAETDAYSGTHVSFETTGTALANYQVGGVHMFDNVTVEEKESHHAQSDVGSSIGLEAVTNLQGLGLSLGVESETQVAIESEGSASLSAHDTDRGILTLDAGGEGQYAEIALGSETNANVDGDRVVVESGNDESETRSGAFIVVGDGNVTVNDAGNVSADLEGDSKLVFRSYAEGERNDDAQEQEELIANGTATAEVYAEERDGEFVADVATYGEDVAVNTAQEGQDRVEMTVERSISDGTVVIMSVSEAAIENVENAAVTVDGEAAIEASSYSELEGATDGDESAYMISQHSDASAAADVLVAINHFSERTVALDSSESESESESSDDTSTDDDSDDEMPGFGAAVALVSLLVAAVARVRLDG